MNEATRKDLIDLLDNVRAILRGMLISDLPGVAINRPGFASDLPPHVTAVYFLRDIPTGGLLYIGRATNLRDRWSLKTSLLDNSRAAWDLCHAKLEDALSHGQVKLHWLEVERHQLAIFESMLLEIYHPLWNCHRG